MKKFLHEKSVAGEWFNLSLAEQLANIGSEVSRASKWQGKDKNIFWGAVERALELFDLTITDSRWKGRLREIARAREVFCDAVLEGKNYQCSLEDLESYFLPFTFLVRKNLSN
jgi:hypothetical protein